MDRIISLKLSLKGQQSTLKQLDAVTVPLEETAKLLGDIKTKSVNIDAATQRVKALTQQVKALNTELAKAGSGVGKSNPTQSSPKSAKPTSSPSLRAELATLDEQSARYKEIIGLLVKAKQKQAEITAEIKRQTKEFENSKVAIGSYRDLNNQLVKARENYKNLSEAQRKSNIGKELLGNITQLDTKLKTIDASIGQYTRNVGNYSSALNGLKSVAGQYLSATALLALGNQALQQNAEISDSIANVAKTANASIPDIQKLAEELKFRDTRTSLADQLKIAEIGGQLGETADTLASFTAAIDVLGVALGDEFGNDVGRVTKEVAGLRNTLGDFKTEDAAGDILKLGNALNVLSASGNATAGVTVDIASRIAGLGTAFGLTAGQILGLSSRLDELNIPAERAGGSIQRVLNEIARSPELFAQLTGKSIPEFTKIVNEDLTEAFLLVLDSIGKSGAKTTEFANILEQLGIDGVGAGEVFSKLGQDTDALRKSIDLATTSLENTDSVYGEFTKKNQTLGAELQKLKNDFLNALTSSALSDVLAALIGGFRDLASGIKSLFVPSKGLRLEFDEMTSRINTLDKELPKLLEKYSKLKAETTPTKKEQEELATTIKRIGELTPTAIIEVDKYGNALEISAEKSKLFLEAEKARLNFINKDLIKSTEAQVREFERQVKIRQQIIKEGKTIQSIGGGGGGVLGGGISSQQEVALSPEKIAQLQSEIASLQGQIEGATAQINFLKTGTAIAQKDAVESEKEVTKISAEQIEERIRLQKDADDKAKQRREKELEEIKRAAENIQRLQLEALDKTFEGRKQRAEKEGEIAIAALVGTPEQVKTQTDLIKAQVKRSIEEIEKDFQEARAKALAEITALRDEITSGQADFQLLGSEREVNSVNRFYENQIEQLRLFRAQQFAELEKAFARGEITASQFEEKRVALEQDFSRKRLDFQKMQNAELAVAEADLLQKQLVQRETAFQAELAQIERQLEERKKALGLQVEGGAISPSEGQSAVQSAEAAANAQRLQSEQKFLEDKDKLNADFALKQIERTTDIAEQEQQVLADRNENLIDLQRQYEASLVSSLGELSNLFGEFVTGQERDSKQFFKNLLVLALDALEKLILIQVAAASAQSFAQPDSVATFGATGAARAAILTGLITAGFGGLKALVQSFEEGGSIPGVSSNGEGVAQGASHANGGIKTRIGGRSVEIEGGEHILKNGRETYIINKRSSRLFSSELQSLHGNTSQFIPRKRALAEQINTFRGFGRAFAPVRKFSDGGALSISPLAAPVLPTSQSEALVQFVGLTNEMKEMIVATNARIDRLVVIADPLELAKKGAQKANVKRARSL